MKRRDFLTSIATVCALGASISAIAGLDDYNPFEGLNYVFIRDQTDIPYIERIVHFIPSKGELVTARMTPEFVEDVGNVKGIPFEKDLQEYLKYYTFDGTMTETRLTDVINAYVTRLPNKV